MYLMFFKKLSDNWPNLSLKIVHDHNCWFVVLKLFGWPHMVLSPEYLLV